MLQSSLQPTIMGTPDLVDWYVRILLLLMLKCVFNYYYGRLHITKFTILTIFSVKFSGIKHLHNIVQHYLFWSHPFNFLFLYMFIIYIINVVVYAFLNFFLNIGTLRVRLQFFKDSCMTKPHGNHWLRAMLLWSSTKSTHWAGLSSCTVFAFLFPRLAVNSEWSEAKHDSQLTSPQRD